MSNRLRKHFLFIHGGSHGAWCWEACRAALAELGYGSTALDLPGHGQDETPRSAVSASSYIGAIRAALEAAPQPLTVVAHSLAGVFLPEALDGLTDRIEEIVFLAAIVLEPGECALDFIPEDRRPTYFAMADASADGSFLVPLATAKRVFFNDLKEADAERYYRQLTPQVLSVYLHKVNIAPSSLTVPKRYIICRDDLALGYESCLMFAARLGGEVVEIEAGHDVMLSQAKALAELLIS